MINGEFIKQKRLEQYDKILNEKNEELNQELSIERDQPKIDFYLIEHLRYGDVEEIAKTKLTNGDLYKAFKYYFEDLDYDVKGFKYIGGIHRVGYYFDEDTPHYDGVRLEVIEKEKEKVLNR